jgi:hypothetical protein
MDLSGSYFPEPEFLNVFRAQESIPGLLKICKIEFVNLLRRSGIDSNVYKFGPSAGILEQSTGARNRVGIGFFLPTWLAFP